MLAASHEAGMELQMSAFQLVIGFMMEGLGEQFEAMDDILATTATSRYYDRRLLLRQIGITYRGVAITKQAELLEVANNKRALHLTFDEAKESILSLPLTKAEEVFYIPSLLKEFNQFMRGISETERFLKEWFPPGKRHCINGVVLTLEKWSRL